MKLHKKLTRGVFRLVHKIKQIISIHLQHFSNFHASIFIRDSYQASVRMRRMLKKGLVD